MESRKGNAGSKLRKSGQARSGGGLPHNFLTMVAEIFTTNFDKPLKKLAQIKGGAAFKAGGEIFPNEIVLSVSVTHPDTLAATTVFASVDFDPKASAPTAQDILGACVDAIGAVYGQILVDKKDKLEQIADESLSAMENVPFDWTLIEIDKKFRVYVKIDKSNPDLDAMADDWLAKHDPHAHAEDDGEQKETEKLFVTGPKSRSKADNDDEGSGGNTVH